MKIICLYLKNLKLNIDLSVEIISEIARRNEMSASALVAIVDEFESNYYLDSMRCMINNKKDRVNAYKWQKSLPIVIALDFLGSPKDFLNFCLTSKHNFSKYVPRLHRRILAQPFKDESVRIAAWQASLGKVNSRVRV
jgi:hypothetical protein